MFAWTNRVFLLPVVLSVIIIVGAFLFLAEGTVVAPFIYTIF